MMPSKSMSVTFNCGFILSQSGMCDKRFFAMPITEINGLRPQVLAETD